MFRLVGEEINKEEWLQKLTMGLANTACTADTVSTRFCFLKTVSTFFPSLLCLFASGFQSSAQSHHQSDYCDQAIT